MPNKSLNGSDLAEYSLGNDILLFNAAFLSVVAIATAVGNGLALSAFIYSRELKQITYYFIACLCISDLMVAMFCIPLWIADSYGKLVVPLKLFYGSIDIFCSTLSIMSLAMIAIERYLCIVYALRYNTLMTPHRAYVAIALIAIYSAVAVALNHLTYRRAGFRYLVLTLQFCIVFLSYAFPACIKLFSYFHIYREAKRQHENIAQMNKVILRVSADATADAMLSTPRSSYCNGSSYSQGSPPESCSRVSWTGSPPTSTKDRRRQTECGPLLEGDEETNFEELEGTCDEVFSSTERVNCKLDRYCCFSSQEGITKLKKARNRLKQVAETSSFKDGDISRFQSGRLDFENGHAQAMDDVRDPRIEDVGEIYEKDNCDSSGDFDPQSALRTSNHLSSDDPERRRSVSCPVPYRTQTSLTECRLAIDTKTIEHSVAAKRDSLPRWPRLRSGTSWSQATSQLSKRLSSFAESKYWLQKRLSSFAESKYRRDQKIQTFQRELRAAKVVALIMGTFMVCWTPFMVMIVLYALNVLPPYLTVEIVLTKDLHYLNSAINPALYVLLNKVFRSTTVKVLLALKRRLSCITETY